MNNYHQLTEYIENNFKKTKNYFDLNMKLIKT